MSFIFNRGETFHRLEWRGEHWFCDCDAVFGDDEASLVDICDHASNIVFLGNPHPDDPDVRLRVARLKHALATRVPRREGVITMMPTGGGKSAPFADIPNISAERLSGLLSFFAGLRGVTPQRLASDFEYAKRFIDSLHPRQLVQIGAWNDDTVREALELLKRDFPADTTPNS